MTAPGDIPLGPVGRASLVEALSNAQDLPVEALEEAAAAPGRIAPAVLAVAGRAAEGHVLDERQSNLLFWGAHVLAHGRDRRLCAPLLAILRRDADSVAELLADAVPATLPRLVASVFDGDADALEEVIADRAADEFVRWSLFGAYAFLAFDGTIARERASAFLLRFDETRPARAGDAAWTGWEQAVALLGLRGLAPRVEAARTDARLIEEADAEWFALTLDEAERAPEDPARFADLGLGLVDDVVAELAEALDDPDGEEAEQPEPVRNPNRGVGRNDPCPCGSGRKFKKCCLEAG